MLTTVQTVLNQTLVLSCIACGKRWHSRGTLLSLWNDVPEWLQVQWSAAGVKCKEHEYSSYIYCWPIVIAISVPWVLTWMSRLKQIYVFCIGRRYHVYMYVPFTAWLKTPHTSRSQHHRHIWPTVACTMRCDSTNCKWLGQILIARGDCNRICPSALHRRYRITLYACFSAAAV